MNKRFELKRYDYESIGIEKPNWFRKWYDSIKVGKKLGSVYHSYNDITFIVDYLSNITSRETPRPTYDWSNFSFEWDVVTNNISEYTDETGSKEKQSDSE